IQCVEETFDPALAQTFGLFKNQIVVMIHSGSRRFGYEVADEYMNVAARRPENAGRPRMLSYLLTDTREGRNYIAAMAAAANFAFVNRHIMALLVRRCFNRMFGPTPLKLVYDVTHNMAKLETHGGIRRSVPLKWPGAFLHRRANPLSPQALWEPRAICWSEQAIPMSLSIPSTMARAG
ncbi:MAG: RtcB family protein, partial [Planctomycetota bacterium]